MPYYPRCVGVAPWHAESVGPGGSGTSPLLGHSGIPVFRGLLSCTPFQVFHPLLLELANLPGSCRGGLYLGAPSLVAVGVGTPCIPFHLVKSPGCFYLEIHFNYITWQGGLVAGFMQVDVLPGG